MPAYNSEKHIGTAIDSVLAQDFPDWELIVSDNGSDDRTIEIVTALSCADPRIRIIDSSAVRSAAAARLAAINDARGEWVAFLDSDDEWAENKLSRELSVAMEKKCDFVFSGSAFIDGDGKESGFIFHVPSLVSYPDILNQNIISCSSVLIKRKLLGGCFTETDNNICEDFASWIRILRDYGIAAVGVDEPLLRYRISSSSLSANKLTSAKRTFFTYISVGLPLYKAIRYFMVYIYRNSKKYINIKND